MGWRKVGKVAGYIGFFFLTLVLFLMLTFPEERFKSYLSYRLEQATGYPTELADFEIHGLSGIELTGLVFRLPKVEPLPEPPPEIIPEWYGAQPENIKAFRKQRQEWVSASAIGKGFLRIDSLNIVTDLIDVAFGDSTETRFNAELLGGGISDGLIAPGENSLEVHIGKIQGIKLGDLLDVRRWMPYRFQLLGILGGNVHLELTPIQGPDGIRHQIEGTISLQIKDAVFEEPAIVMPPQVVAEYGSSVMWLTDVSAGDIEVELVMGKKSDIDIKEVKFVPAKKNASLIYFKKLEIDGDDLKLKFSNRSAIIIDDPTAPLSEARLNLEMVFRLEDDFLTRKEVRDGDEDSPNNALKALLEPGKKTTSRSDPFKAKLKRAISSNGDIGFKCVGTLGKPNCDPARVTSVRISGGTRRTPPPRRGKTGKSKRDRETKRSKMVDTTGRSTDERRDRDTKEDRRGDDPRGNDNLDRVAAQKRKMEEARRRRDKLKKQRERAAANRGTTVQPRAGELEEMEEPYELEEETESDEEALDDGDPEEEEESNEEESEEGEESDEEFDDFEEE